MLVSNILGPYTHERMGTMKMLNRSIKYMKQTDSSKYRRAIDKETKVLNHLVAGVA